MKSISLRLFSLFAAASLFAMTSCSKEDETIDPAPTATIPNSAVSTAKVGDKVAFNVAVVAQAKIQSIETRLGTTTLGTVKTNGFTNTTSDTYPFEYTVKPEDAGKKLEFAFIVTDSKSRVTKTDYALNVQSVETALGFEKTGAIIANLIGPNESAYNLVDNKRESGNATTSDMQNPTTVASGWIKGWDGENGTTFVKVTGIDYATATLEKIQDAYTKGSALSQVRNVAVNDLYVAKLRNKDNYAIIKVTKADNDIANSNAEVIEFVYKKAAENTGVN